jgi:hypothetical protein
MYNTDLPRRADLPTSAQLQRSTWIAGISASAILAFIVLPSEYAVDPTGVGRIFGLTQMGEIKVQLAQEAAQDAAASVNAGNAELAAKLDRIETMLTKIAVTTPALPAEAPAATPETLQPLDDRFGAAPSQAEEQAAAATSEWRDEVSFTLTPGEGVEVKLVMEQGAQARFHWTANGAVVNFETHGDGSGQKVSYEQGRGVPEQAGVIEAAFTGNHGWFWRNRTDDDVTLTLRATGAYSEMKRMM